MTTRTTFSKALLALPALGLLGCVSDFSPDPRNEVELDVRDAGRDAGKPIVGGGGTQDASKPVVRADAGGAPPTGGKQDAGTPADDEDPPDDTNPPDDGNPPSASKGACDLSGRWIMSERNLSVAIGAEQVSLGWHYVELEQQGDAVTMKKTLLCGGSTKEAPGNPAVNMDDAPSWPAYQKFSNYNGRKGKSSESGDGCNVTFETAALLRGLSAAYGDMSVTMPTLQQKANGGTPGWEDWDEDGNPGITMAVSGLASGKLFTSVRSFSDYSGSIAANATKFKLGNDWVQERLVYGTDPPDPITRSLLASNAERSPKEEQNFVEFARLAADQATGNDDATCKAIRELAPTLNPAANPK